MTTSTVSLSSFGSVCSIVPLMKREFLQCLQLRRDLEIHSDASFQFWFQSDQLHGAIAATEFQYLQIVAPGQMPVYRALR